MIKLEWSTNNFSADIAMNGNITTDGGLATAVLISLFTDQLAKDTDTIANNNKRGWWGDSYSQNENENIGSLLWMLQRSAITTKLLSQIETYAKDCLLWMIQDGVASKIDAKALRFGSETIVLRLNVYKPDGDIFRYETSWRILENGI